MRMIWKIYEHNLISYITDYLKNKLWLKYVNKVKFDVIKKILLDYYRSRVLFHGYLLLIGGFNQIQTAPSIMYPGSKLFQRDNLTHLYNAKWKNSLLEYTI